MNKRQLEVQKASAQDEAKTLRELRQVYTQASKDCAARIQQLSMRTDLENLQSIVYQRQYQEIMKKQIDTILDTLNTNAFTTVTDYLGKSYENGYIGTLYDLQGQGVPLVFPINQEEVVSALQTDSKISNGLYSKMGEDTKKLKTSIRAELSRGIAAGQSWNAIAGKIAVGMNSPFDKAMNRTMGIARTEGHRVQQEATLHCQQRAKSKGADVVKQWDSTLDGKTRPEHRELDGQIREVEKPFEVAGMKAMFPSGFGDPSQDCNCRCCLLQRARWALKDEEFFTKWNGDKNELVKIDARSYDEFKEEYSEAMTRNKISENNAEIEVLSKKVSELSQHFEQELLFGDLSSDEIQRIQKEYNEAHDKLQNLIEETERLKKSLPKETIVQQAKVVDGKQLMGKIDYNTSSFDHVIEITLHEQGFDGTPTIVEYEEFDKAMKKSGFYAERTYSAATQEQLDEYRQQLYTGKWYVDCSEGGAQYGQGMYCASCYDLKNNKQMGGIGMEMSHYQDIGITKGNGFSYTEAITLQPDTRILELPQGRKADEYISNVYRREYIQAYAKEEQREQVQRYVDLDLKISNLTYKEDQVYIDSLYASRANATVGIEDLIQDSMTAMEDVTDGRTYHGQKNAGALAAEMGYDAIKATGHGDSGSYTVILNRTKIILCEGGSIYGN